MSEREELTKAVGRRFEVTEMLDTIKARHLAATFDRDAADLRDGGPLPAGWHWLYFLDAPPTASLGIDGRTVAGGFLPETGLPRRMWAGGRFDFHAVARLGTSATCDVVLTDARRKQGRSGALAFLTTRHVLSQDGEMRVEERRDLVFRDVARPGESPRREPAPGGHLWSRTLLPDEILLFRFSALTFNAHRIHYDVGYCRTVEGYPDLVVHGPMLALLLLDLLGREMPRRGLRSFDYRAVAPVFAHRPIHVRGRPSEEGAELWVEADDGSLATHATARLD